MRLFLAYLVAMACCIATSSFAQTTLLYCGRVVDVRSLAVLPQRTIVIVGRQIASVEHGYRPANGEPSFDLRAHTCLPGLTDLHVHLTADQLGTISDQIVKQNAADFALRAVPNAEKTLLAGFTSVRDLISPHNVSASVRDAIHAGRIKGPRVQAAGVISTPGGHGDLFAPGLRRDLAGNPGPEHGVISGPEEAARVVRQYYRDGLDLIKVTATGGSSLWGGAPMRRSSAPPSLPLSWPLRETIV